MIRLGTIDPADIRLGTVQPVRLALGSVEIWSAMDADAAAYIAAVEAAGATVSAAQSDGINSFIVACKASGSWSAIKRIYLPIWAAAGPNAICIKSLTSGSFAGNVTHASGYCYATDATGYMDPGTGSDPATLGLTGTDASMFCLQRTRGGATGSLHGSRDASTNRFYIGRINSSQDSYRLTNASSGPTPSSRAGVWVGTYSGGNLRMVDETSAVTSFPQAVGGPIPSVRPYMLATNNNGSGITWSTTQAQTGMWGYGQTMSDAAADALAADIFTLWTACTGLTIP